MQGNARRMGVHAISIPFRLHLFRGVRHVPTATPVRTVESGEGAWTGLGGRSLSDTRHS